MDQETKKLDFEAKTQARKESGFNAFMRRQEIKLLISLIPEGGAADVLSSLLKAAFNEGVDSGSGMMAGEMLYAILDSKKER